MKRTIIILVALMICLPLVSQASAQWFLFENPLLGKQAKDFSLENLSGQRKSLVDIKGDRAAIIFFWATWCPHCRTNLKMLNADAAEIAQKDISVLLVDLGERAGDVERYLAKNGIEFETLLDVKGDVADTYGVQGIPTFIYISSDGVVKAVEHEWLDDYEAILEK